MSRQHWTVLKSLFTQKRIKQTFFVWQHDVKWMAIIKKKKFLKIHQYQPWNKVNFSRKILYLSLMRGTIIRHIDWLLMTCVWLSSNGWLIWVTCFPLSSSLAQAYSNHDDQRIPKVSKRGQAPIHKCFSNCFIFLVVSMAK